MTARHVRLRWLALLCVCLVGIGACGQKGPLYLPERPSAPAGDHDQPQPEQETGNS